MSTPIQDSVIHSDSSNADKLVLVDTRVQEKDVFLNSVKTNVSAIILDFENDTYDNILTKIQNNMIHDTLESIALVGHGQYEENYSFLQKENSPKLKNISLEDPNFDSWNIFLDFLIRLKDLTSIKYLDLLGCAIVSYDEWKLILNYLETNSGINIRASIDNTGNLVVGGNWILETDNVDAKELYFTNEILNFDGLLSSYPNMMNHPINIIKTSPTSYPSFNINFINATAWQWYYCDTTGIYTDLSTYTAITGDPGSGTRGSDPGSGTCNYNGSNELTYEPLDSHISSHRNQIYYYCKLTNGTNITNSIPVYMVVSYISLEDSFGGLNTTQLGTTLNTLSDATNIQWQSSDDNIIWNPISNANSSSYTSDINFINKYIRYSCIYNNTGNETTVSNSLRIVPYITTNLMDILKTVSTDNSLFSITATGGTSYQWQSSLDKTTFTNIPGATSSTYNASSQSIDLTFYRCILNGYYTSNIRILLQPYLLLPNTINVATTTNISTKLSAKSFQWQSSLNNNNWTNISGATTRNYTPSSNLLGAYIKLNFSVSINGVYTPIISTNSAQIISNSIPLSITTQPVDIIKTSNTGSNATPFTIQSNSNSHQWQFSTDNNNFAPITGANVNNYTPPADDSRYITAYRCLLDTGIYSNIVYFVNSYKLLLEPTVQTGLSLTAIQDAVNLTNLQWKSSSDNSIWSNISGANSSFYTPVDSVVNKYIQFTCNFGSKIITSNSTRVIPSVTTQPVDIIKTSNTGSNATLFTIASNSSSYQWQFSTDNNNFAPITGANVNNYTPPADDSRYITAYRCLLDTGIYSNIVYFVNSYKLLLEPTVQIGLSLNANQYITNLSNLQWKSSSDNSNWSNISGANSSTYTPDITLFNKYIQFTCKFGSKDITSNSALIVKPNITTQPSNIIKTSSSINSSFDISSDAISWQWYKSTDDIKFEVIPGANVPNYIPSDTSQNITYYYCNLNGDVSSNKVYLLNNYLLLPASATSFRSLKPISRVSNVKWRYSNDNINWTVITTSVSDNSVAGKYISYTCNFTYNSITTPITSNSTLMTLSIKQPVDIIHNLSTVNNKKFIISANATTFQWEHSDLNDPSTFSNIPGATTSSYQPTEANKFITYYRCLLNGIVYSNIVYLLNTQKIIGLQPSNIIKTSNDNYTSFSIFAYGSLQWQIYNAGTKLFEDIVGQINNLYTPAQTSQHITYYRCRVNFITQNATNSYYSKTVYLLNSYLLLPSSSMLTIPLTVFTGASNIQWRLSNDNNTDNSTPIDKATSKTYKSNNAVINKYISYTCDFKYNNITTPIISNSTQIIAPNITTQPLNYIVSSNSNNIILPPFTIYANDINSCNFNITLGNSENITYRWEISTNNKISYKAIVGANGPSQSPLQSNAIAYYRCMLNGIYASDSVFLVNTNLLLLGSTKLGATLKTISTIQNIQWQISTDNSTWANITNAVSTYYKPLNTALGKYIRYSFTFNGINNINSNATLMVPV